MQAEAGAGRGGNPKASKSSDDLMNEKHTHTRTHTTTAPGETAGLTREKAQLNGNNRGKTPE